MSFLKKLMKNTVEKSTVVYCPVKGTVIDIVQVNDEVFNSKAMGEGVGIIPEDNRIFAPISGEIVTLFPTKHAIGIKNPSGLEVLIHIGINTVELEGRHYNLVIHQGEKIEKGDFLGDVSFKAIAEKGYETTVVIVVTNSSDYKSIECTQGIKDVGEQIIRVL